MVGDFLILRTSLYVVGFWLARGLIDFGIEVQPLNGVLHPWLDTLSEYSQAAGGLLMAWLFPVGRTGTDSSSSEMSSEW